MITTREATLVDLPEISRMAATLDEVAYQRYPSIFRVPVEPSRSEEWLRKQLEPDHIKVFVAIDDRDACVGFIRAHIGQTPDSLVMTPQTVGWLHELIVESNEPFEAGAKLVQAVHEWLAASGISQIRATLWPMQTDAAAVLSHFGYIATNQNLVKNFE